MIRNRGKEMIGKIIVSEETGRKFGIVGDMNFIAESGELLNIVLVEPTKHSNDLNLERDEANRFLIPFSSVKSVGDFVIYPLYRLVLLRILPRLLADLAHLLISLFLGFVCSFLRTIYRLRHELVRDRL
jgi:sporulation protein YlmC with PRC-barrel domain